MLSAVTRGRRCVQLQTVQYTKRSKAPAVKDAKEPMGLNDIMNKNVGSLSPELALLAKPNPFALIKRAFNPFAMRTFKEFKDTKSSIRNSGLRMMCATTEDILVSLSGKNYNMVTEGSVYRHTHKHEIVRRQVGNNNLTVLKGLTNDNDYKALAAMLSIILPKSDAVWIDYDHAMHEIMKFETGCSIDAGLLAYHAMLSTGPELKIKIRWKTPTTLLGMIVNNRSKLLANKVQANVFDFSGEVFGSDPTPPAMAVGHEVFSQIGEKKIRESRELERLGLIMRLLANPGTDVDIRKDFNVVAVDATEYGMKVLSSLKDPAPVDALKVIWTYAPKSNLPNTYLFYKSLYEQVLYSITCDPLQLVGEESSIASLLESMVASKFKSSQLIAKLFEVISARGMDYHKIGLRMFGSLVALNSMPFANSILNSWVESSEVQFEAVVASNTSHSRLALQLPEKATQMVCHMLAKKTSFQFADLAVVVTNCGRPEHRDMVHLKVLRDVEAAMVPQIPDMTASRTAALLYIYADAGRRYPPIINALNQSIADNLSTMNLGMVNTMIWAAARLNDRDAVFLDAAVARSFEHLRGVTTLSQQKVSDLARLLWSLAVLRKLDLETFHQARPLIEEYASAHSGEGVNNWVLSQLNQAWLEIQILLEEKDMDEGEFLLESAVKIHVSQLKGPAMVLDAHTSQLPWHREEILKIHDDTASSYTHLEVSKMLTKLGVEHENEVQLSNGYIVDVLIPIEQLEEIPEDESEEISEESVAMPHIQGESAVFMDDDEPVEVTDDDFAVSLDDCHGVVLEFDGPSHYESYRRAELGTTVMKRRHIQAAGYKVINLPYWRFTLDQKAQKHEKVIKTYLQKAGLRIKQKQDE